MSFICAFFRTLPTDYAEAAVVDGCSHTGVFFRVMLPTAKPGLPTTGTIATTVRGASHIFSVLGQWNQLVLPQFLSPELPVRAQGIAALLASQS